MHRTQIYLDTTQRRLLNKIAAERGTSLSELIREAIWRLVAAYRKPKGDPLQGIVALYRDEKDSQGSVRHDDLYE